MPTGQDSDLIAGEGRGTASGMLCANASMAPALRCLPYFYTIILNSMRNISYKWGGSEPLKSWVLASLEKDFYTQQGEQCQ